MADLPTPIVVAHGIDQHPDGGEPWRPTPPPPGYFATYLGPDLATGRPLVVVYNLDTMMAPIEILLDRAPQSGEYIERLGDIWRVARPAACIATGTVHECADPKGCEGCDPAARGAIATVALPTVEWRRIVEALEGSADADLRTSACLIADALDHPGHPRYPRAKDAADSAPEASLYLYVNQSRSRVHRIATCAGSRPQLITVHEAKVEGLEPCAQCQPPLTPIEGIFE